MSGTNPVAAWELTDFTTQDPTTYRGLGDGNAAVAQRVSDNFAPHQAASPAMSVVVDAGFIAAAGSVTEKAQQTVTIAAAPASPNNRIDLVVVNATTGVASVIAGTPATSPSAPALTASDLQVCQVSVPNGTTAIINSLITDLRAVWGGSSTGGVASAGGSYIPTAFTDVAIQAAHDACYAAGGGEVLLLPGIYLIGAQLNFNSAVSLRGSSNGACILKATAAVIMLVWNGGSTPYDSTGVISNVSFDGNGIAICGPLLGGAAHYLVQKISVQGCVDDGVALCMTQNAVLIDVFSQSNGNSNFALAGGVWNTRFIGCGMDGTISGGGSSAYNIYSKRNATYFAALGSPSGTTYPYNHHNTWLHPVAEGSCTNNIVYLDDTDDVGCNSFDGMEFSGGAAGNPQIHVGAASSDNTFRDGELEAGSTGASYAIDNYAFGTKVLFLEGTGWSGVNWIRNAASGGASILVLGINGTIGTVDDLSGVNALTMNFGPVNGAWAMQVGGMTFSPFQSDGEVAGALMQADGRIEPSSDNAQKLGIAAKRWSESHSVVAYNNVVIQPPYAFAGLPAGALDMEVNISDSPVNTWGTAITAGGGAYNVKARFNGTNWTVVGI